jgi:hypothetical protein
MTSEAKIYKAETEIFNGALPPKNVFRVAAPRFIAAGYRVTATLGKRAVIPGWSNNPITSHADERLASYSRSALPYDVGVVMGDGVVGADRDTEDREINAAIDRVLPESNVAKKGQKGRTDFYCDATRSISSRRLLSPTGKSILEILGPGTQSVMPPSRHPDTNEPYRWLTAATCENTRPEDLTPIDPDIVDRLEKELAPWLRKPSHRPVPVRPSVNPCELSGRAIERHRRYAETILERRLAELGAMAPNSGRNHAAFRLVCRLGRWAHAGVIAEAQLVDAVLDACRQNQLVRDDGRKSVLDTIASGLRKSAGDQLPDLADRVGAWS